MNASRMATLLTLAGGLMLGAGLILYGVNQNSPDGRRAGWLIAIGLASLMAGITLRPDQTRND